MMTELVLADATEADRPRVFEIFTESSDHSVSATGTGPGCHAAVEIEMIARVRY